MLKILKGIFQEVCRSGMSFMPDVFLLQCEANSLIEH
ncbi:hypothetical protein B0F87_103111 [Methylobacter tundripaludum]|uniref:Uncharacterized protein n=1 Tax=Methylobacter tundripaludum TaxID=173365 RepID=A0A2S6HG93_9GAMM|nr:hypothetical protein B0F87_103111 [Methylobacter tundripaludum]